MLDRGKRFRAYMTSVDCPTGYPEMERMKIVAATACDDAANQENRGWLCPA